MHNLMHELLAECASSGSVCCALVISLSCSAKFWGFSSHLQSGDWRRRPKHGYVLACCVECMCRACSYVCDSVEAHSCVSRYNMNLISNTAASYPNGYRMFRAAVTYVLAAIKCAVLAYAVCLYVSGVLPSPLLLLIVPSFLSSSSSSSSSPCRWDRVLPHAQC